MERQVEEGLIAPDLRDKIVYVLLRKHRHQTKKPIHRSLADIGKTSSSSSEFFCFSKRGPRKSCSIEYLFVSLSVGLSGEIPLTHPASVQPYSPSLWILFHL